jgi:glutathione S-transferase
MGIVASTSAEAAALKGIHLYHGGMSNCSMRVRMTLEEKGLAWTSHHVDLRKAENATPKYFAIHPKGLVPALVHDGVVIIESTDIIDYLDERYPEPPLHPADEEARKKMHEWMRLAADNHISVKAYMFANQIGKRMAKSPEDLAKYLELQQNEELRDFHAENSSPDGITSERLAAATAILEDCFAKLDATLAQHEWLAGDAFSLADITWVPLYVTLNNAGFPLARYPNVVRWKDAVRARPSFEKAVIDWVPKDLLRD